MPASDVTMTHPDLPDRPVSVSRRQFDHVWKSRGWRIADTAPDAEAPGAEPADEQAVEATPSARRSKPTTSAPDAFAPASTSKEG